MGNPPSLRVAGASARLVDLGFERLPGALPRARLVGRAVPSAQPAIDIERIDVERVALVEEPDALEPGPTGSAGTSVIDEDLAGAIRITVKAPTRGLLVLAESFHPGWRVNVDGADARVLRVNGDFMGVVVEPGDHAVSFSFAPRSFAMGCWTSLAGIAIVLSVALAGLTTCSYRG
jgi:Bacterial membrane protein YfhO